MQHSHTYLIGNLSFSDCLLLIGCFRVPFHHRLIVDRTPFITFRGDKNKQTIYERQQTSEGRSQENITYNYFPPLFLRSVWERLIQGFSDKI